MAITHYLPFTEDGAWLTEKLFGVIIYIALGFIALGRRRPRSQQSRFIFSVSHAPSSVNGR